MRNSAIFTPFIKVVLAHGLSLNSNRQNKKYEKTSFTGSGCWCTVPHILPTAFA
jgi:hypothetical protein